MSFRLRLFLILLLALIGYGAYLSWRVDQERVHAPQAVADILTHVDPAIDAMPPERIDIFVRVEDPTFWTNEGIDFATPGAGWTTISQGLGKHVFFERYTPGFRKIELMALTHFALEGMVSKKDILRATLASAYLGHDTEGPIIGFAAAARRWYGLELKDLSREQFISLVAMMPGPNDLDPARHPKQNAERVRRIERMLAGSCKPDGVFDVALEGCAGR